MSIEKARYNGTSWNVYQKAVIRQSLSQPVARFVSSSVNYVVNLDASASSISGGANATIASYLWLFDDGSTASGVKISKTYTTLGAHNATLTVVASDGPVSVLKQNFTLTQQNRAPVANLALTSSNLTVTYTAAGSTDPDGDKLTYDVNWGDGSAHSSAVTDVHTYASAGAYTVTLVVSDGKLTNTTTKTANPTAPPPSGGGGTATPQSPWKSGSPTEGLPSSVPVVKWSSIATSASDNNNPMVAINRLTQNSVVDISNEQLRIPSFVSGSYMYGIAHSRLMGFIGGISNGVFNNQITLNANAMTQAQANTIQAAQTGTSQTAVFRSANSQFGSSAQMFMMGVHWVGADQPKITDNNGAQFPVTPARMKGLDLDVAPAGSIFQNCLLEGVGASNGNTPPWEVGSVDFRRSNGMIVRRVEVDGRLPVGSPSRPNSSTADPYGRNWLRTGGIQWNADINSQMTNVSLHDTLVSGLTYSVAGTSNNGSNNSQNLHMNYVYLANNSQKGFSGTNLEDVLGSIEMNNCTFIMNGTGGQHVKLNPYLQGVQAPNITNWVIREPTWSGLGYNGMFAVGIAKWGSMQTTAPTVIKNGKQLTAKTSDADPASNYRIVPL